MIQSAKRWGIALILLIIILGAIGWYLKNKKVEGLDHENPDYVFQATDLYQAFVSNEPAALKKYSGKILEVEGVIQDVRPVNDTTASLWLIADAHGMGTIKCGIDKHHAPKVQALSVEQKIKVRCICSGVSKLEDFGVSITDLELDRCVIIE